jgi:cell division protein FtsB
MNVADSIWDKLTRVVICLLLVAGVAGLGVAYYPKIRENERFRKRVLELDLEVQKQTEIKKQLSASIEAMNNDPKAVERLARETLGYAKPGETVIRFGDVLTNRPTIQ